MKRPGGWLAGALALGALGAGLMWSARSKPAATPKPVPQEEVAANEPAPGPPVRAPETAVEPTRAQLAPSPPAVSAPEAPEDEATLMAQLRRLEDSDPEAAILRARAGNQLFPDSPDAPERSSILIHALAATGRSSEARGEAEDMVNHYPDSNWVREVEHFTGAHRHRNAHLTADGQLAFD